MKKILSFSGTGLLFLAGLALLFYPDISNWLAERNQSVAFQEYNAELAELTTNQIEMERKKAEEYNNALSGQAIKDPFIPGSGMVLPENYLSVLSLNGYIGLVEIPLINVSLPIYHGTAEDTLKKGVGHMEMTAFPIGGEGNHSVLTGHTGLPSAMLLTNLDKIKLGDKFYIHVLNETLAYEVDQILVVKPENTENLRPMEGKDYVTLFTCTPYGVNSHRLLVRGTRIPFDADELEAAEKFVKKPINWRLVIMIVFIIISANIYVFYKCVKRRERDGRL